MTGAAEPEIRYAKSGDVYVAYQTIGDGPVDLVGVLGFTTHLEHMWEEPSYAAAWRRLAAFSRVILLDKRGTGLSDRLPNDRLPTLEERMDDVRAVMDAAGSERAIIMGFWEGGAMAALFAATHPERTRSLMLVAAPMTMRRSPDYPWAFTDEDHERILAGIATTWGQGRTWSVLAPTVAGDERRRRWLAKLERVGASPGAALALWRINMEIDVRHVLPAIHVPTLVLHRRDDHILDAAASRWTAGKIEGARYVELPGTDHLMWFGEAEPYLAAIEDFVTGGRAEVAVDRVLATILFVDVVASTERAAALGDARWAVLRDGFYEAARREIDRQRGREVKTTGDGLLATFDGPARAVRAARGAVAAAADLGLAIRAGVHTGECEMRQDDVGGLAVHIAARLVDLARPGEVVVSSTVRDLVAGSGLAFTTRGTETLRGVPGEWRVYTAA